MTRKSEVLPPTTPLLCDHITLKNKHYCCVKCLHFSRNVMLSVGVSRMGKTSVVFIDPGVNSSYCCNVVLEKGLLPDIRGICRHYRWTLQQDGAPAHTAPTTMDHLKKRAYQFHWTTHVASK